jgi:hypothetical protein
MTFVKAEQRGSGIFFRANFEVITFRIEQKVTFDF